MNQPDDARTSPDSVPTPPEHPSSDATAPTYDSATSPSARPSATPAYAGSDPSPDYADAGTTATSTTSKRRFVGAGAHLTSVVVAVLAVPGALLLLDRFVAPDYLQTVREAGSGARLPNDSLWALGGVLLLLLLAAGIGRLSGLGPLVAGIVWGVLPTVLLALDPGQLSTRILDLPSLYDGIGESMSFGAPFVLPALAGLLVGAGLVGRWRRPAA